MFQAAEIRAMLDAASQQGPGIASGANLILLYDGHGSTRGLVELMRMRLRRTDVAAVVQCLILAKQGGVKISCAEMEKAWTQKVDIEKVTLATVRAKREGLDVTFQDLVDAELDDRLAEKLQGKDEGHKQEFAYR